MTRESSEAAICTHSAASVRRLARKAGSEMAR